MRRSSQKDLSVYDFDEADLSVEESASKYAKKRSKPSSNPKEERLTRDHFLQAFTSGHEQVAVTDISCIDLSENGSPKGSFVITSPERNFSSEENSELDEIMASTSYDEKNNLHIGEFDHTNLVRVDPLVTAASGLLVPIVGNEHVSDLRSDGFQVDIISDDEEASTTVSLSPSASTVDLADDEDYQDCPTSDNFCTTYGEKDNGDMQVIVSPDYVIYGETLYEEALLIFSPDTFVVECLDACGTSEKFLLEYKVADIIHIECQWSGSVQGALIKFRLRAATVNRNEIHATCDVGQLIFAVTDMHWQEKEEKIKSLATKYEDVWNVLQYEDLILGESNRQRDKFFPRHYFLEIPDSFEDAIYPKGDPDAVSISKRDIEQLQPDMFLNDTIIDFYIKYLKGRIQPSEKHRFHFFNSFFFRKLADLDMDPGSASEARAAFLRVRKWTRKVDIFEKDYIFIPVNFNLHWSLLVICHPGEAATSEEGDVENSPKVPCILHMDSIKGSHSGLKNLLQSYLWEEWKERNPEAPEESSSKFLNFRFVPLELPQQENSFDCGLFLLHYVELFLEEAPITFNPLKIAKFSKFLTLDWFSPSEASFKRYVIRKLIYDLLTETCQNVNSSTFCNGNISLGDCQNLLEQGPANKFLSERCSASIKVASNSFCYDADAEIRMNYGTKSHPGASLCDKQEGLLLREYLESTANTVSFPKHDVNPLQENAPSQIIKSPKCPTEESAYGSEELVCSSLEKNDGGSFGGFRRTAQICSASNCPKDDEIQEIPWSIQGKEIGTDFLPRTLHSDHLLSNQKVEEENPEPFSTVDCGYDCGYVPDSPTSSSGMNPEDFKEIGAGKTKVSRNSESYKMKDKTEATSDDVEECQETHANEGKVGCVNEPDIDSNGECEEIGRTGAEVGSSKDLKEIVTSKEVEIKSIPNSEGTENGTGAECGKGEEAGNSEDFQEAKLSKGGVGDAEDCQVLGLSVVEAVDIEDCKIVDTAEVEGSDEKNSQQICANPVTGGSSCRETLRLPSDHGDNRSQRVGRQLKRGKPATGSVIQYQKRPKLVHSGSRRYTRSLAKDLPC